MKFCVILLGATGGAFFISEWQSRLGKVVILWSFQEGVWPYNFFANTDSISDAHKKHISTCKKQIGTQRKLYPTKVCGK